MIKKVLFVLMPKGFQDYEFETPYKILNESGYVVDVAGLQPGVATGEYGLSFTPNLLFSSLQDSDFDAYDALVIPGGPGSTTYLWNNQPLQNRVWWFNNKKKIVAAICHACGVLAQAGILAEQKATIYPSPEAKAVFADNNVKFVDQGCVTLKEEKIVTAQGPKFVKEFAAAIISQLKD
jgi:protease I